MFLSSSQTWLIIIITWELKKKVRLCYILGMLSSVTLPKVTELEGQNQDLYPGLSDFN